MPIFVLCLSLFWKKHIYDHLILNLSPRISFDRESPPECLPKPDSKGEAFKRLPAGTFAASVSHDTTSENTSHRCFPLDFCFETFGFFHVHTFLQHCGQYARVSHKSVQYKCSRVRLSQRIPIITLMFRIIHILHTQRSTFHKRDDGLGNRPLRHGRAQLSVRRGCSCACRDTILLATGGVAVGHRRRRSAAFAATSRSQRREAAVGAAMALAVFTEPVPVWSTFHHLLLAKTVAPECPRTTTPL